MNENDVIETEPTADLSGSEEVIAEPEAVGVGEAVLANLREVLGTLLTVTQDLIADYGGAFLVGLFTLLLAWMLASFFRGFTAKILRAAGVDLAADRLGLRGYLRQRDVYTPPSQAMGWLLYLAILYTALIVFFEVLELEVASTLLRTIAGYLPQIFVAVLLVVLGFFLGRWTDVIISRLARVSGLPGHVLLGKAARIAVFLLASIFAVNSLGWVSPAILLGGVGIVLGTILGFIVLFCFCARQMAESILARGFLSALVKPGEQIKVGTVEGVLLAIEPATVRIDCGDRIVVLPSHLLANGIVEIRKSSEEPPQI
ncbi:MAG: hypothetical protein LAT55_07385 [Opitutales bacterium]|nr:hypothetical protein [Opitutales bacterium]